MAKRKRLTPARMLDVDAPATPGPAISGPRPPIADVAQDAAASAALREVAAELTAARTEGRLIQRLPLTAIVSDHLVRDRIMLDPDEQAALVASIADRGQQTPIEVTDLGDGRYGLISGYRRLHALREIPALDTVLALIRHPAEASDAYRAMVDENEMRVGLSFYERARIVVKAVEADVYPTDQAALRSLFAHVPRARRSKIKSFLALVRNFDHALVFPTAISEKLGLDLVRAIESKPRFAASLRDLLAVSDYETPEEEVQLLTSALSPAKRSPTAKAATPAPEQVSADMAVTIHAANRVELSGAMVADPGFRRALLTFLREYK